MIRTFDQIIRDAERAEAQRQERRQWGRWHLDPNTFELVYRDADGRLRYFVDLERMNTSAAMLDWIFQVRGKGWCKIVDMGHLIEALADIFDPQARLCSFACIGDCAPGQRIDASAHLRRRYSDPMTDERTGHVRQRGVDSRCI